MSSNADRLATQIPPKRPLYSTRKSTENIRMSKPVQQGFCDSNERLSREFSHDSAIR